MKAVDYKMVVFDFDGTLADSVSAIANGIMQANKANELPECSFETAKSVIGLGFDDMIRIIAPSLETSRYEEYKQTYVDYYRQVDPQISLFDGVKPLFQKLRLTPLKLALATGKSRRGLSRITHRLGIDSWFHDSITSDEALPKPHPLMLEMLMKRNRLGRNEIVMVGDTEHDIKLARNAGVKVIAVSWGAQKREQLEEFAPDYLVDNFQELQDFFFPKA